MALRLTAILAVVIFLIMRFGGGPIEKTTPPELATAPAPDTAVATGTGTDPDERTAAPLAADAPPVVRLEPLPDVPQDDRERVTLAPPPVLAPALDDDQAAAAADGFEEDEDRLISPVEALPNGLAGGSDLGLAGTLDLQNQVNAALEEARPATERPSLADLAQPGGGQTTATAPAAGTTPPTTPAGNTANLAEVTATSVNLRGGPSTLNAVVGRVSFGDVVELRGEFSGGWAAIRHPDTGETAYISSQFLAPVEN